MGFRILAALMLACVMPGTARAAWLEASSDHFVVYADDSEKDVVRFSRQLESYHAAMALTLRVRMQVPSPSNRVTVFVVKSENQVRKLYGEGSKYVGGFYMPRAGSSIAIVPSIQTGNGPVTISMVTLLHEYAHHMLMSTSAMAMPRWFNEGAAEFFASSSFEAAGDVWLGRPAQHRAGELFFARDVKAADLLDPDVYEKHKSDSYDAFYGKSWLLYHYLTFSPDRKGQLDRYVDLLREGKGQRDAGIEAFGDFNLLEKDLDKYLTTRRISALKIPPSLLKIGDVRIRPLPPGEAAIMPVRIQSKRGVNREMAQSLVVEARAIAAKYPADAALLAALAECEHDAGNEAQAIAAADAAIKIDPSQVNAYVQKGLALFSTAEKADDKKQAYRDVRRDFVALNRLENDHPLPLIYYYRSFVQQGIEPPPLAIEGLTRAVELAPFDPGLRMNLGFALLKQGRSADARTVLRPVAYSPHGAGASAFARKVIDRIDSDPTWKGDGMEADDAADGTGDSDGGDPGT